jgi:hypothetical protein
MTKPSALRAQAEPYDAAMRASHACGGKGDFEGARAHLRRALEARPDDPEALWYLSAAEMRTGRLGAAEAAVTRLIEIAPHHAKAPERQARIQEMRAAARNHAYARQYAAERALHMDYPRNIAIETVGRCNAKCGFCPHGTLERRFSEMPDALFEKILADLAAIPPQVPTRIFPNLVNEPFMDKKIFARLARINEVLPDTTIWIFTNFNVLPKDFLAKLRRLRNLEQINVSFNAANEAEYQAVMGIDFARTIGHLKALMAENRRARFLGHPVVLSRVSDNTPRDAAYEADCRAVFAEFTEGEDYLVHVKSRTNWLGATDDTQSRIPHALPCGAWLDLNIMCTGTVPLCCIDARGEHAIGDANTQNLLDIYNGPVFRSLRENEATRETATPCADCSLMQ